MAMKNAVLTLLSAIAAGMSGAADFTGDETWAKSIWDTPLRQ